MIPNNFCIVQPHESAISLFNFYGNFAASRSRRNPIEFHEMMTHFGINSISQLLCFGAKVLDQTWSISKRKIPRFAMDVLQSSGERYFVSTVSRSDTEFIGFMRM